MTGTIPEAPEKNIGPFAGIVRITPGVKSIKNRAGIIRSAKVMVNLKTKLITAQLSMAKTRA
jgi:hypothetical protein